ncbi:hypothetical protein [Actinomadura atramentaria]|uniref:hypothetical protein n=1 Tax=Actinomadura atramentaria TaxID=1990 RepID=UPI0012F7AFF6|nr:hypothetical protein [Actinomadura atramentaria]
MPRRTLVALATAGVVTLGAAAPAVAAPAHTGTVAVAKTCKAQKKAHKSYWVCVTPGSYCPKAAHKRYGYAYKTNKRYRCVKYSNGRWRWKRA